MALTLEQISKDPVLYKNHIRNFYAQAFPDSLKKMDEEVSKNAIRIDWIGIFNRMSQKWLWQYIHPQNIEYLKYLIYETLDKDFGYGKAPKMRAINGFLKAYCGLKAVGTGTSRTAYISEYDPTVIIKLGRDVQGRMDNLKEKIIQQYIKPHCAKVYDVTPDGLLQLCERTQVLTRENMLSMREVILEKLRFFYLLNYVFDDVGFFFFKNWGLRENFGPVIIDFSECYLADQRKLVCRIPNKDKTSICGGVIHYDPYTYFSQLVCNKCHARYAASSLAKDAHTILIEDEYGIIRGEKNEDIKVKFTINKGSETIYANVPEIIDQEKGCR